MNAIKQQLADVAHDLTADDKATLHVWVTSIAQEIEVRLAADTSDSFLIEQKAEVTAILEHLAAIGGR